jgi:stress-induced morphogen
VKLTDSDIPTDDALIRITDDFIRKYGIDVSHHAKPIVYNAWRTNYAQMKQEGTEVYIPETFTVTYPIQIDEHLIYEGYSGYKGLSFTVDIRSQRVSGMTGLEKHQLIASDYPLRDASRIQKLIVSG